MKKCNLVYTAYKEEYVFDDNNYSTFVSDDPIHQISTVVKKGSIIDAPALNAEYESFGWYSHCRNLRITVQ